MKHIVHVEYHGGVPKPDLSSGLLCNAERMRHAWCMAEVTLQTSLARLRLHPRHQPGLLLEDHVSQKLSIS